MPEANLSRRIALEPECPLVERDCVIDLVPARGRLAGAVQPPHGLRAQARQLVVLSSPGKVGVLGANGLGVVVPQERRVLVALLRGTLEPLGKRRMQPRALRLREA